jgi:hypothetical protein
MTPEEAGHLPASSGSLARGGRQWPLRFAGCLFGAGCWAVGLYIWLYAHEFPELEESRATGFALTAFIVGLVAILGSLLARDVHALWYCSPTRWRPFRRDVLGDEPHPAHDPGIPGETVGEANQRRPKAADARGPRPGRP